VTGPTGPASRPHADVAEAPHGALPVFLEPLRPAGSEAGFDPRPDFIQIDQPICELIEIPAGFRIQLQTFDPLARDGAGDYSAPITKIGLIIGFVHA